MHGRSEMPLTKDDGDNHIVLAGRSTGSIVVTRDKGIIKQHPEYLPVMRPEQFAQVLEQWRLERPRYGTITDSDTGKAALVIT